MGPCPYVANMATNSKTTAIKNKDKWSETSFHIKKKCFKFVPLFSHNGLCICNMHQQKHMHDQKQLTGSAVSHKKEGGNTGSNC